MAGRRSTVEDHPKREEIEMALVAGKASKRSIARQFGLSYAAVLRHVKSKLVKQVAEYREKEIDKESRRAKSVSEKIDEGLDKLYEYLRKAEAGDSGWGAIAVLREIRGYLELQRKIEVEGSSERSDSLYTSEEVATMFYEVIKKHPSIEKDVRKLLGIGKKPIKPNSKRSKTN